MTKRCDFLNRNLGGESTGTDPDTSQKVTVIEDDTRFMLQKYLKFLPEMSGQKIHQMKAEERTLAIATRAV